VSFFIGFFLSTGCATGGNHSDNFLSATAKTGMDDKDNRSNSNRSKGDESFLAVVQNVWLCQREWVVKNELGGGKVYAKGMRSTRI